MSVNLSSASRQGIKEEALPWEKEVVAYMTLRVLPSLSNAQC